VNRGLIGALVITRRGMARPDGTPKDVDRELVAVFMEYDENQSWFIDANIKRFTRNPQILKFDGGPVDPKGNYDLLLGTGFGPSNFRWSINGYQFANMPVPRTKRGDHVCWSLLALGEGFNFHTPHWHGNTMLVNGQPPT